MDWRLFQVRNYSTKLYANLGFSGWAIVYNLAKNIYNWIFNFITKGVYSNNTDITKEDFLFIIKCVTRSVHAHWKLIVPESSKFGQNHCHVFSPRRYFYIVIFHIEMWMCIILEYFQLVNHIAYSRSLTQKYRVQKKHSKVLLDLIQHKVQNINVIKYNILNIYMKWGGILLYFEEFITTTIWDIHITLFSISACNNY